MPLDIGESVNYIANAFLSAPIIYKFAKNPIYTAMLIVFIVMLIVMFVFKEAETEESLLIMCFRVGFWSFITILGVMFLHNKVLTKDIDESETAVAYNGIFNTNYHTPNPVPIITGQGQPAQGNYNNPVDMRMYQQPFEARPVGAQPARVQYPYQQMPNGMMLPTNIMQ